MTARVAVRVVAICCAAQGCAVLGWSSPARAASPVDIAWTAPEGCPTQAAIEERFSASLPARENELEPLVARAKVVRSPSDWAATLTVEYSGRTGERNLRAPTCSELGEAVVVILSLLVRESLGADEPEKHTPASLATASSVVEPTAPAGSPPRAKSFQMRDRGPNENPSISPQLPSVAKSLRGALLAGKVVDSSSSAGLGVGFAVAWGRLGLDIAIEYWPALSAFRADEDVAVSLDVAAARVAGCYRAGWSVGLAFCLGPRLEHVSGQAPEVDEPASDAAVVPGLQASALLRVPTDARWGFVAGVAGGLRLRSVQVDVAPYGSIYEIPRWTANLLGGADVSF
ncbi:MAG TPA: hypothetical protein VF989_03400 [Polyangiaceae bacterium]